MRRIRFNRIFIFFLILIILIVSAFLSIRSRADRITTHPLSGGIASSSLSAPPVQ